MNTYGAPLLALALLLALSLVAVGRGQGWRCLFMMVAFPAILFAGGWLLVSCHFPVLPVLLVLGLGLLAGQVFLLLGPGAAARLAFLGAAGFVLDHQGLHGDEGFHFYVQIPLDTGPSSDTRVYLIGVAPLSTASFLNR